MTGKAVIVGVDATPAGALAAATGWTVAQAAGVPCRLVHVTPAPSVPAGGAVETARPDLLEQVVASARARMIDALRGHAPDDVLQSIEVLSGNPAWELRRVIAEVSAGLLVLGGKHHAPPVRWLGGSTVHNAVRTIDVPILVAAAQVQRFSRVLVAIDLSETAEPTLTEAHAFAAMFDAALRVLTIVEPMPSIPDVGIQSDVGEHYSLAEREAKRLVDTLGGIDRTEIRVDSGSPARTIADEAAAWEADLVVVGSHGKGWVDRVLLGSTTERLLNRLPCSTLVIPVHGHPEV
jgi:nucleotide-binding universal stress UspA family protein